MKTKSIYKTVLIRCHEFNAGSLKTARAKRVYLSACPERLFFLHKNDRGKYAKITDALSGAVVFHDFNNQYKEKELIEEANKRIKTNLPPKFKTFDDFVTDYILRYNLFPLTVNLKVFNN